MHRNAAVGVLAVGLALSGCGADATAAPFSDTTAAARVEVTPEFLLLDIGRSAALGATVFSATGARLTRQVSWTSRDGAVATVDPSGQVRARTSGFVYVEGRVDPAADSLLLAVPAPATCPAATIKAHGFDDGTFGPFEGAGYSLAPDPTARGSWSATHTWRRQGVESYAGIHATFAGVTRVYARWRYKQDPGFEDSTAIKKLLFTKGPGFSFGTGLLVISRDRFMWYYDQLGDGQTNYFTNVGPEIRPSQLRGDWHWYEVMNDISTSGALHMRLWVDGVLKMDHVVARPNQGQVIGSLIFNGTTNAPGTNGTDWLDELAVSVQCIGFPR